VHATAEEPWSGGAASGDLALVDPRLGSTTDFLGLVDHAHRLGLEVALELSWTISSSHPWLSQHPHWWVPTGDDSWRLDLDADPGAAYGAVLEVVRRWVDRGVSGFVVQDAHRWPLAFWEQLLLDVATESPDVVVVAEGDPSAAQAHALALVGFHQTTPPLHRALGVHDVEEVLAGLGRGSVQRPHLVAASSHRRAPALSGATSATHHAWAAVAALAAPAWGVVDGFADAAADHDAQESDAFLGRLNELRRAHPALRRRRGLVVHPVHHAGVLAFSRTADEDALLVVVDLFPAFPKTVGVRTALGDDEGRLQDELDGTWHATESILLDPEHPVRVLSARR
jgi:starch synthase (maltosyl-transferring)